ncbi:hypothetical protein OG612_45515 (plasmid) [Streptomyces sp. NBC_01527]|uniref:hypothetical protein n=1 Tax=Streptomyces sp. NBC_01527 TaxID=2903894 RepID=UPI002F91B1AF
MAVDCPALPVEADLSCLWVVVMAWTSQGPHLVAVMPYTRDTVRSLRQVRRLWDLELADSSEDAARAWQVRLDEVNAEPPRHPDRTVADVVRWARLREESLAAIGRRAHRASSPGDGES